MIRLGTAATALCHVLLPPRLLPRLRLSVHRVGEPRSPARRGRYRPATDEDGRLPTGDLGTVDARGIVTVTGREKELIITDGGRNIAPARIESLLRTHPPIAHAVAVGGRRPYVAALLVLGDGGRVGGQAGGAGGVGGKSGAGVTGDLGACGP